MEASGQALCDWSRASADPDPREVEKLCTDIDRLVVHIRRYPTSRGRNYLNKVCDVAASTINALEKITFLLPRSSVNLIEAHQWNQTKRIRDVPSTPHEYLADSWESWASQISDAAEEIKRIADKDIDDEMEDEEEVLDSEDDDAWLTDLMRKITPSETAMAKECYSIVKLTRSLMRKVKIKCISGLTSETITESLLVDALFELGSNVSKEADNLATAVFPVQNTFTIRENAIKLAKLAQNMAEIASGSVSDSTTVNWFDNCIRQLDKLVSPVIERSPLR